MYCSNSPLSRWACCPWVTKSYHVRRFQHKYCCLNTVPQERYVDLLRFWFHISGTNTAPVLALPSSGLEQYVWWNRPVVYLLWSGEALARHWPKASGRPLINGPDLGEARNAALHLTTREKWYTIMVAWHVSWHHCLYCFWWERN